MHRNDVEVREVRAVGFARGFRNISRQGLAVHVLPIGLSL